MMDQTSRVRRTPAKEAVIASVSAVMLVWVLYPRLPDQQVIHIRGEQDISVPVGDPSIHRVKHLVESWDVREPIALIGRHRWASETAKHYARLAEIDSEVHPDDSQEKSDWIVTDTSDESSEGEPSDSIQPVSYSIRQSAAPPNANVDQAVENGKEDHLPGEAVQRWKQVSENHETALARIDQRVQEARNQLHEPPIALGRRWNGPRPAVSVPLAALVGIVVLFIWQSWVQRQPAIDLRGTADPRGTGESTRGDQTDKDLSESQHDDLMLRLPRAWVAVHQPLGVQFRLGLTSLLFLAAVVSVWSSQWGLG